MPDYFIVELLCTGFKSLTFSINNLTMLPFNIHTIQFLPYLLNAALCQ
jgi:hypothetical protein